MKCINCGNELPEGSMFCNVCGTNQSVLSEVNVDQVDEKKPDLPNDQHIAETAIFDDSKPVSDRKKRNLNKQTKIALALCLSGLILILAITLLNNPVSKFVKAVEGGNVVQAKEIFDSEINSETDLAKLVDEINKKIDKIYQAYLSETITYDDAKVQTLNFSNAVSTAIAKKSNASETLTNIESVYNSKVSYITGKQYQEKSDYVNSINMFLKVVPEDTNYDEAQAFIEEMKPKYRELLLKEINDLSKANKFKEALGLVGDGLSLFKSDLELTSLKQSITIAQSNYISEQKRVEESQKRERAKNDQLLTVASTKILVQHDQWKALYPDLFSVVIRNNSGKTLKSFIVSMLAWDINGYPLKIERMFYGSAYEYIGKSDNVNLLDGQTSDPQIGWDLQENHRIIKTKAVVLSAEFFDGNSWTNPYYNYFIDDFMGKPYID